MRPLTTMIAVFAAAAALPAGTAQAQPQSCQVLKLVLGPLHLDLLGLVVDLYGKTRSDPVIVMINAQPSKGPLGQLLCGLAGGGGVTDLGTKVGIGRMSRRPASCRLERPADTD